MIPIPAQFLQVPYNGASYPGAAGFVGLEAGANCQVFAYAFLAHHGIELPPLRSSDLWEDCAHTFVVTECEPLDLLLFHDREQAYGAHVAVCVGDGCVLHLAAHRGYPAVETIEALQGCPKYRYRIGVKRPRGVVETEEGASRRTRRRYNDQAAANSGAPRHLHSARSAPRRLHP